MIKTEGDRFRLPCRGAGSDQRASVSRTNLLIAVPTVTRHDLLNVNFREVTANIDPGDHFIVLDNGGNQPLTLSGPRMSVFRADRNLGVAGSWNWFFRIAFVDGHYDALLILSDDIRFGSKQIDEAKNLLSLRPEIGLFLSFSFFDVQLHRRSCFQAAGFFDERFSPAWCEDDDYALTLTRAGQLYERFHVLDPLPGSQREGSVKSRSWAEARVIFAAKWPDHSTFGVNDSAAAHYVTNRCGRGFEEDDRNAGRPSTLGGEVG